MNEPEAIVWEASTTTKLGNTARVYVRRAQFPEGFWEVVQNLNAVPSPRVDGNSGFADLDSAFKHATQLLDQLSDLADTQALTAQKMRSVRDWESARARERAVAALAVHQAALDARNAAEAVALAAEASARAGDATEAASVLTQDDVVVKKP